MIFDQPNKLDFTQHENKNLYIFGVCVDMNYTSFTRLNPSYRI